MKGVDKQCVYDIIPAVNFKHTKTTYTETELIMKTTTAAVPASLAFAQGLFVRGTDCIGFDELKRADVISNLTNTPLLFPEEELRRARELKQFLILHNPTTMQQLHARTGNKLGAGKLLYDIDWYRKQPLFTTESPALGYKLVGSDVIPGSTGVNYLEQTEVLATYLTEQVFGGMEMPVAYRAAINEFKACKEMLRKLMNEDWKLAAEKLSELMLNRLFRGSPVETLYNSIAQFKVNGAYYLPNMYHWTASRSLDGRLVGLGDGASDGVRVRDYDPGGSGSGLGVVFSRSVAPDLVS